MSAAAPVARYDRIDGFAALLMVGLTFSWGLNQVAIKLSNTGFNPLAVSCARSAIGGALVLCWCWFRSIRLWERDGTLWAGLWVGALFGAEFALIFFGLDYTTASRGVLMINTMPFFVLVGAHFLLGERMRPRHWGGLLLAFSGVALVLVDGRQALGGDTLFGDALCLGGGVLWAATTLVIKRTKLREAVPEKLLLYQLGVSALMTLPLVPLAGPLLRDVSMIAIGSVLFQAVFVVAFTYILWFWLMRSYPAAGLTSFTFLTPVFGVLASGLLLAEPVGWNVAVALALIACGLLLVNRPQARA
ncbi:MAG: EamA family transporter [Mesorhizobium amorphae]|nr:MAG: EamA family transporter [Mesorhizobium amorphae]